MNGPPGAVPAGPPDLLLEQQRRRRREAGVLARLGPEPAAVGAPLQGARHAHPPQDILRARLPDTHGPPEVSKDMRDQV